MTKPLSLFSAAIFSAVLVTAPLPAFSAGGVPTIDVGSIAELKQILSETQSQLEEAIQQNIKLDEQTMKLLEQIKLMEDQIAALRTSFDEAGLLLEGDWLEGLKPDIGDLGDTLTSALEGKWDSIGKDGKIGDRPVSDIVDGIFTSAGTSTSEMSDLAKSEVNSTARIGAQGNTGAMMGVAAEASQEAAKRSLERLEELTGNIPDTQGLKEAIDLNTRMTAELGIQLGNIWQMEAAQTIGLGQAGVMTAATMAEEQKYLDLTPGDE